MKQWTNIWILLKKLWSMKVMVIAIVVGAFGTVPKGMEKRLGKLKIRKYHNHQITVLLKSARILRRVQQI